MLSCSCLLFFCRFWTVTDTTQLLVVDTQIHTTMGAATVSARSVRTLRILFGLVIAYTLVLLYLVVNARYAESEVSIH